MNCASQRIVWASISVAIGASFHAPTLALSAEASNSASIPTGAAEEVT